MPILGEGGAPVITVTGQSATKISAVSGKDYCQISFTATQDLTQWEARSTNEAAGAAGRGVGLLVGSGTLLPAGESGTFYVYASVLAGGEGSYRITIYGCDQDGNWSDCVIWQDSGGQHFVTSGGKSFYCQRSDSSAQSYRSAHTAAQLEGMISACQSSLGGGIL